MAASHERIHPSHDRLHAWLLGSFPLLTATRSLPSCTFVETGAEGVTGTLLHSGRHIGCIDRTAASSRAIPSAIHSLKNPYLTYTKLFCPSTLMATNAPNSPNCKFNDNQSPAQSWSSPKTNEGAAAEFLSREVNFLLEKQKDQQERQELESSFYQLMLASNHHSNIESSHWHSDLDTNSSILSSAAHLRALLMQNQQCSPILSSGSAVVCTKNQDLYDSETSVIQHRCKPKNIDKSIGLDQEEASLCHVAAMLSGRASIPGARDLVNAESNTVLHKRLTSPRSMGAISLSRDTFGQSHCKSDDIQGKLPRNATSANDDRDHCSQYKDPHDSKSFSIDKNVSCDDIAQILAQLGSSHRRQEDPYFDLSEITPTMQRLTNTSSADSTSSLLVDCEGKKKAGVSSTTAAFPCRYRAYVQETFPEKLHMMLNEMEKQGSCDIVSFFKHGRAFTVHDVDRFVSKTLPVYFNQSKWNSFQRQLNLYGFQRIQSGPDRGGYYHELFLKGRPYLCTHMRRVGAPVRGGVDRRKNRVKRKQICDPNFYSMKPMAN